MHNAQFLKFGFRDHRVSKSIKRRDKLIRFVYFLSIYIEFYKLFNYYFTFLV